MRSKKKRRLRQQIDTDFIKTITHAKEDWIQKKTIVEKSIEPSDEVLYGLQLAESRYSFLLKEAKVLFTDKPS